MSAALGQDSRMAIDRRLSVAPMLDWTDRHCRYFHRLLSPHALLYTEMVTTGALRHGDVPRHLAFNPEEHPLALQLGGSEPGELAHGVRLAAQWGYDEVNLNCGCPSERVQRGSFGACLMAEPTLVRDCVAAMADAAAGTGKGLPITVKHRIGLDRGVDYGFVRDFVGTVAEGGCQVFIVHARNAWLKGLSPKENREVPPLRYDFAYRLKQDFPALAVVVNGGITTTEQVTGHLQHVDGVMIGREAYHHPWSLVSWDRQFLSERPDAAGPERADIEQRMIAYMDAQHHRNGVAWPSIARHMMGLWNGMPGARRWRQVWSDHRLRDLPPAEVSRRAAAAMRRAEPASSDHIPA